MVWSRRNAILLYRCTVLNSNPHLNEWSRIWNRASFGRSTSFNFFKINFKHTKGARGFFRGRKERSAIPNQRPVFLYLPRPSIWNSRAFSPTLKKNSSGTQGILNKKPNGAPLTSKLLGEIGLGLTWTFAITSRTTNLYSTFCCKVINFLDVFCKTAVNSSWIHKIASLVRIKVALTCKKTNLVV